MHLPQPRGPISTLALGALRGGGSFPGPELLDAYGPVDDYLDDDLQVTLWTLYELHYRGFDDVDARWEWSPDVIALRSRLEEVFEAGLRRLTADLRDRARREHGLIAQMERIVDEPGPSMAAYLHREATHEQFLEFLTMRSLYHLKESDPHAWLVPRLAGAAKAGLAEIQYDEFGGGDPTRVHQRLYADALRSVGLDDAYGAYVDAVPAHTLAVNNAMSLFGLHRRLRGACAGHLAAFEMTSSLPCRRIAQGADRLELPAPVLRYFEEHVEADAVHEHLALRGICAPLVDDEPGIADDVLLGAAACVLLDVEAARATLDAWAAAEAPVGAGLAS